MLVIKLKMVEPEIKMLIPKLLVGKHLSMCMQNNRTAELWKSFMPNEIKSAIIIIIREFCVPIIVTSQTKILIRSHSFKI